MGRSAQRDDPQALQAHHVVNTQAAGVSKIGPQHFNKGAETVAFEAVRRKGRDAPALALAIEQVRWRTDGELRQQFILAAPGLASAAIGAHCQIGDQANGHTAVAGRFLCLCQTPGNQPLAKGVVADLVGMFFGKYQQRRAVGVAPLLGPEPPVDALMFGDMQGLQRFEPAVVFKCFTTAVAKLIEVLA